MKKIIILVVLIALAAAGWYGYKKYSEPNPDLAERKPDHTMDATALIAAFDKDSASASKQYIQKLILVTGTVTKIDTSGVISLGHAGEMSSVQCTMDRRHKVEYASLKEGQPLSIKGTCTGYNAEEMLGEKLGTNVQLNFSIIENKK